MLRKKNSQIIQRLFIWIFYFFSGFVIYTQKEYLFSFLITFAKVLYPLSIFWLQIRIKKRGNFLSIDSSMSTSQLWFNLLPVLASLITVILVVLNAVLYIADKLT